MENRPPWILDVPDDEGGRHFLVGISERYVSERDAREEALRNATKAFARYTGVEITDLDEFSRSIYGSSSNILDATVSGKNQTRQEANAFVSRVKGKQYYFETSQSKCGDKNLGVSYQYWVLAEVPVDEYERVQAWKESRERSREEDKSIVRNRIVEEISRLSALEIDGGRDPSVYVLSNNEAALTEVKAWVGQKLDGHVVPAPRVQLDFKARGTDGVLASGRSDANGQALFQVSGLKPGNYDVVLHPSTGVNENLSAQIQGTLDAIGATISVKSYMPDLAGAARAAVHRLFSGPAYKPLTVKKVVMGPVRYQGTRFGSEFGKRLEKYVLQELLQVPDIQVLPPPKTRGIDQLVNASKTRGIGMNGASPAISDPAVQAQLDGADGFLEVSYVREGRSVAVDLQLKQARTGLGLYAAGENINENLIPQGLQIEPLDIGTEVATLHTSKSGQIHLQLTTQKGDGMTFSQGEKVDFYVSSDHDAYLLILYQDASKHLIQVYPNSRSGNGFQSAGDYIKIPDESDTFEFTIEPPFGIEQVWAFASTAPFPSLRGTGITNGLTVLTQSLTEVAEQLRAHGKSMGVNYGEGNVVLTTVRE
jgi:hypothetical protein